MPCLEYALFAGCDFVVVACVVDEVYCLRGLGIYQVCHSNALIREAERMQNPNPVNQTSVPVIKEIDTAVSTLKWDQYHDGQRQNRGTLKAVRFKVRSGE